MGYYHHMNNIVPISNRFHSLLKLPNIFCCVRHATSSFSLGTKRNLGFGATKISSSNSGKSNLRSTVLDIYNCNIKISQLGRHGNVRGARKLFDEMPHHDNVSYTAMITAYLKNNELRKAEKLFQTMPDRTIVAESAMIDGYAKAGLMDKAQKVFDAMIDTNVFSWTSLISGYFRDGQVAKACQLFDQMPAKNVVSWTTMVLGYARNGLIDQARSVFNQMPEKNTISWTAMMKSYVDNGRTDEALKLFHEMPQRNLYSWNTMISGCLDGKRVNEAFKLFHLMPLRNAVSWTIMVSGLARNGFTKLAREYFDQMPNKDIAAWNAMITAYVDECLIVEASELFNLMTERNIVTWNAMIDGYARHRPAGEAMKHLILMLRSCIRPNETTMTIILTSCWGMLELMQAHALAIVVGCECETSLSNALITMYSRIGDISSSRIAFESLKAKDVVSWTAMLLAFTYHGHGDHALHVFGHMLKSGTKPDEITFVGVLSACSHAGLVKKGQKLFDSMSRAYGLEPRAEHYSCLVDILGRAGQVHEAMDVVWKMPECERDGAVLGALLGACRLHGNVEMADYIGQKLIELEPNSSGGYVLLANVFAARGNWDEFAEVRKKMKDRNVRKVPGFSQIEVKGKCHAFFAGDKSHPQVEEIYELLREKLLPIMHEMGYSQWNQFVPSWF